VEIWTSGYVSKFLLKSYSARMLQDRLRVSWPTFVPFSWNNFEQGKDTKFRPCIPIEDKISLKLHRLGSGDTLHIL
jgi:hypothetical protein